jgi:ABC-2 type transport system ATP-binding protein
MTRIVFEGVTKAYGRARALDGLTFAPEPGRVTGFVGPNGAGKTTALRILLGLAAPTSGRASIDGRTYAELDAPSRKVGAAIAAEGFHPGRSGRDGLRVLARVDGVTDARVDELLEVVGLADAGRARVRTYSLGMRQRLALAGALLSDPAALVLDEPTNGLDPYGVRWLRAQLRSLAAEGRTVLVSSHQLAELGQTVDDVALVDRGRVVAHAPLPELLPDPSASLEDVFLATTTDRREH